MNNLPPELETLIFDQLDRSSLFSTLYVSTRFYHLSFQQIKPVYNYRQFIRSCRKGDLLSIQYHNYHSNIDIKHYSWESGLSIAANKNHRKLMDWLIQEKRVDLESGFRGACRGNQLELAKWFIENGCCDWDISLVLASIKGHHQIIKLIFEHCDHDDDDIYLNETLVEYACSQGRYQAAKLLIENGADALTDGLQRVLGRLNNGDIREYRSLVDLLMEKGNFNVNDWFAYACGKGFTNIFPILQEKGAVNCGRAPNEH
jgi:ankyrin repeat protein